MRATREGGIAAARPHVVRLDQAQQPQAEHGGDDQFDLDYRVRTCDVSQFLRGDRRDKERFAEQLGLALQEIGFAVLVGHGIDGQVYEIAKRKAVELFTRPSLAEKMRFRARRVGAVTQGYLPTEETSDLFPELAEGWVFCRCAFDVESRRNRSYRAEDFWPHAELEPFFRRVVLEQEKLILPLAQSVFTYFGCDPHYYDARLTNTNFGLRLNYYPPVAQDAVVPAIDRHLGHEDIDLLTLLPASDIESLQVRNRNNLKWTRIEAPHGSMILNTGDYMQRITNDLIPSSTYRVSRPQHVTMNGEPRVSMPMAVYLWEDELVEVLPGLPTPKYDPVRAVTFHTTSTRKLYGDGYAVERI